MLGWPAGPGLVFLFGDGFFRVKLDQKMKDGKQYRQPKETVNRLYIPRTLDRAILSDPQQPLYFTEGEKKAIKMCQDGLPAVAATGVYGWLHDNQPIPDLDRIAWEGRQVTIVFDSDPGEQSKGQVQRAERWLAAELTVRDAVVTAIHLPDDGQVKVGADDFLAAHSAAAFRQLPVTPVLCCSPLIPFFKKGERAVKEHVNADVNRLISDLLGLNIPFEYDCPVRTILHCGQPSDPLTTGVKYRGETRIRVGKFAWPYAVVYYNLLCLKMQPRGRYTMVKVPSAWLPIWQGLMEIAPGSLVVPDEYHAELPLCAPQEARDVMDAWLQTLFIRQRACPGRPATFNAGNVATMLGTPLGYAREGWACLTFYGYVDVVAYGANGEGYYVPGRSPVTDPEAYEREFFASLGRGASDVAA